MQTQSPQASIFTFGYGNRKNYDQFLEYLQNHEIDCVVDVRHTPRAWTRKWYGQQIQNLCSEHDVEYYSEPALGNTSGSKNWIPPNLAQADQALQDLAKKIQSCRVLLLCSELDHHKCHRTEVAEQLMKLTGSEIHHCC
ncbi:DUF488 domain-containing protein [[Limnothrix rosea] IAM M-220]|uniref:DUF488 domain-containing protein n=1 Tax=[Limnothrix rosea] IAM M-220 TaxID=454133 RepID=UPI00095EC6D5|nr:DUF488 domain-containing protein [[Limnothrix rosea] IAM M-220]OKH17741.1 hypothetical protein NIES208_07910 [[Limnothrix rosea] IAM M-220]